MPIKTGEAVVFVVSAAILASLVILESACATYAKKSNGIDPAAHADAFRRTRSLHDLQALLPLLELGLPRERIEQILGTPDYCPTDNQCYYGSDSANAVGVPYGLVVDYEVLSPYEEKETPSPGKLESFSLMAIGE
jgi:hypothetical protein